MQLPSGCSREEHERSDYVEVRAFLWVASIRNKRQAFVVCLVMAVVSLFSSKTFSFHCRARVQSDSDEAWRTVEVAAGDMRSLKFKEKSADIVVRGTRYKVV